VVVRKNLGEVRGRGRGMGRIGISLIDHGVLLVDLASLAQGALTLLLTSGGPVVC
jgi:hypothetical protein